jgi:hypothetical protein
MVFKVNHVVKGQSVQGQPRDQVQGNPHSTVIFMMLTLRLAAILEQIHPVLLTPEPRNENVHITLK